MNTYEKTSGPTLCLLRTHPSTDFKEIYISYLITLFVVPLGNLLLVHIQFKLDQETWLYAGPIGITL